ncbi:MAG: hypothetical protein ACPGU9_06830 [Flavobacteriaceae bacterium]
MEEPTVFLAAFWGWLIITFCVMFLIAPKRIPVWLSTLQNEEHLVLPAILTISLGLTSVLLHNIWELNWKLIITVIGWSTLLKGMYIFVFPKSILKFVNRINPKRLPIFYIMMLLFGLILLNQVYQLVLY